MGLVEISALATLIGANSAEALNLGARGAGGLPWATMSTFGMIYAIKASISAAMPHWLRDSMGLRSMAVDAAIGMSALLDVTRPPRDLRSGATKGISIDAPFEEVVETTNNPPSSTKSPIYTVQAFSATTEAILESAQRSKSDDGIPIHQFRRVGTKHPRDTDKPAQFRRDLIMLTASLSKIIEIYVLWRVGGGSLWWITALSWIHAFVSASILILTGLSVDVFEFRQHDLVTGELPTPLNSGGAAKLVLGMPGNIKTHYLWTIFWITSVAVNCAALLSIFVTLGKTNGPPQNAVYFWAAFQALWLFSRIFMYQTIPAGLGPRREGVVTTHLWAHTGIQARRRALRLMMGVATQLVTIHPRGIVSYQEDLLDVKLIQDLLVLTNRQLNQHLPPLTTASTQEITFIGLVGDTVFRSIGWLTGSLNSPDIYDCVLIFLQLKPTGQVYAIPSVRVLAGIIVGESESDPDPEARISAFDPRGTGNNGRDIKWVYWVPTVNGNGKEVWLEVRGMEVLGKGKPEVAKVVSQAELQSLLQRGSLNIGFSVINEVWQALEVSRRAAETLVRVWGDCGFEGREKGGF